jgi:anthranilate synthase/aminodeoxychorismate synthase-like glutamine amidotransferase
VDQVRALKPDRLLISPGPCSPNESGLSNEIIRTFSTHIPTLGVCLGHQCIGHSFGGEVIRNSKIMHGKVSPIHHDGRGLFAGMSNPFDATRYHSLVIKRESWTNPDFEISAWTAEGEIMGLAHRDLPVYGVQFHPESILTQHGKQMLKNFLDSK